MDSIFGDLWLVKMAFSEPINRLTEMFYQVRRDKTFYSVHVADYFIFNEDLTIDENTRSSYSKQTIELLSDRIKRWEIKDPSILSVNRISLEERKDAMNKFVLTIQDRTLVEIFNQRINNLDGKAEFELYFANEVNEI